MLNENEHNTGGPRYTKCFDQILRPVVYKIADLAGMPKSVLDVYRKYQEGLQIRSSV